MDSTQSCAVSDRMSLHALTDDARVRPALPPMNFVDKLKNEETDFPRHPFGKGVSAATSPTFPYPVGPPPPYSSAMPAIATAAVAPHSDLDVYRRMGEEKEQEQQPAKQVLPSLQEALGVDQPLSQAPLQPAYTSAVQPPYAAPAPSSPERPIRRSLGMEPLPALQVPYSHPPSAYTPYRRASSPRVEPESERTREYAYSSGYHVPPMHARRSPVQSATRPVPPPFPAEQAHSYEPQQHPGPAAPRSVPYGYAPLPPQHSYSTPSSSMSSSAYQPSTYSAPLPPPPPTAWRSEKPAMTDGGRGSQGYSESVKRHLDMFDFESALNEIMDTSAMTNDFSRQYGARLHQTQRSGLVAGTLPSVAEIDNMMIKSRQTLDAFGRMREVLVAQEAAYYQQAQEQRYKAESDAHRSDSVHLGEDAKGGSGGFAGGESKKRRGRAAAPGRCHSCNRAETPEWRRGPDGARTLCNACGLHYAKLTRKAGGNKAAAPSGGSGLRPSSPDRDDEDA